MSTPSAGLEYAARYTHTFRDGRTIQVTNTHHERPTDRAWAVERLEEMVRAQQALGCPVDAHLVTRRAATEWAPEQTAPISIADLTPGQHDGWACIVCGQRLAVDDPAVPAGQVPAVNGGAAWQLFRCVDCPQREVVGSAPVSSTTTLTESIGRVAAYLSDGPPRTDQIADGKVRHAQATDHISRRSAGFAGGIELFHDLLYSDLVVVLAAARVEANALTASPEPADASPAISGEAEAERLKPAYPEPGSEIPGQPGYVVGICGHRLAGSEWRAGFRTCENCTDAQDDDA